jgi:phosphinothricin acetyltransferase
MPPCTIRPATPGDLAAINAIYNHYVLHSTCTYQTEPTTPEERAAWFAAHGPLLPVTIAELDGAVAGWGALSRFHGRSAYRHTVEDSVYVHPDFLRRGIGSTILADLIERAREIGHHTILGVIDADQGPSIALHERFGFRPASHLREVGHKFGRWLDVVHMQLIL